MILGSAPEPPFAIRVAKVRKPPYRASSCPGPRFLNRRPWMCQPAGRIFSGDRSNVRGGQRCGPRHGGS